MARGIAEEFEVRREAALGEHAKGVAANRKHPTDFDQMMLVERESVFRAGEAARVTHGLAVIFTGAL